jgi:hypothetical protein
LTHHVTEVFVVPVTVAVNCWVAFVGKLAEVGDMLKETALGLSPVPARLTCCVRSGLISTVKVALYDCASDGVKATSTLRLAPASSEVEPLQFARVKALGPLIPRPLTISGLELELVSEIVLLTVLCRGTLPKLITDDGATDNTGALPSGELAAPAPWQPKAMTAISQMKDSSV